jgi:hypothetical protein
MTANYDLVILCRTGKAEEALRRLRELMGKLKLTVNEQKTRTCKVPGSGGASTKNSLLGHAGRHDSDIGAAFEQVGREAVSQRTQAHPFLIPAASAPRGIYGEHGLGRSLEHDAVDCGLGGTGGSPANIACRGGPIDAVLFTQLSFTLHAVALIQLAPDCSLMMVASSHNATILREMAAARAL